MIEKNYKIVSKSKISNIILSTILLFISCNNSIKNGKENINQERLITVDKDVWMSQNLNVSKFKNGDKILLVENDLEWSQAWEKGLPACRYVKYDKSSIDNYGMLYNWYAIADERGLAPDGFHIATIPEWNNIINYYNSKRDSVEIGDWLGNDKDVSIGNGYSRPVWWCSNYDTTYQIDKIISIKDFNAVGYVNFQSFNSTFIFAFNSVNAPFYQGFFVRCIQNKTNDFKKQDSIYNYNTCLTPGDVKIGKQIWDKKNLNVTKFRNGDNIYEAKTPKEWYNAGVSGWPAFCNYSNWSGYGKIYGKLYNWYAVSDSRGLAPEGWHIPSYNEWMILRKEIYGNKGQPPGSGKRVKNVLWSTKEFISNNQSGFSALPGGYIDSEGVFRELGHEANWWTSTNDKGSYYSMPSANSVNISDLSNSFDGSQIIGTVYQPKSYGYSVRCIKD